MKTRFTPPIMFRKFWNSDRLVWKVLKEALLMERLKNVSAPPSMRLYSVVEAIAVWQIREAGPRAAAFAPGAPAEWEGWDDSAVAPEKLGGYLCDIRRLL